MGLEFLARVRRATLLAGAVVLLVMATYAPFRDALGVGLGIAWSLANFALLERLVVAITGRERGTRAMWTRGGSAAIGMLALFGVGGVLLMTLPPMMLLAGFLLPFAVLTLKAASTLLLGSRAWRWIVASPWRASLMVASLLVAAWWLVPNRLMTPASAQAEVALAADPHAQDPHATPTSDPHAAPADSHATDPHGAAASGGAHGGESHGGEHAESGPQGFPNALGILAKANPDAGWVHFMEKYLGHHWEVPIYALLIGVFICFITWLATRNAQMIPGRLQNLVEMLFGGLYDFLTGILGEQHGRRFVPFLGTLFVYIWLMNLSGLLPFWHAPTSSLNITVALALTVFLYCQWVGLRGLGLRGYVDHLMGAPRDLTSWLLVPLMLPIHILGELAKPISLSCRLFGNIFGEDMLLVAFVSLGVTTLAFTGLPFGLPLQLPFMFLALLTSTLQALVFTVLSTIYLLLMLPHHEEHTAEEALSHAH